MLDISEHRHNPIGFLTVVAEAVHDEHRHKYGKDFVKCKHEICESIKLYIDNFHKGDRIWTTKDGQVLKICEMEDTHLINAYKYIKKKITYKLCEMNRDRDEDKLDVNIIIGIFFPEANYLKEEIQRRNKIKNGAIAGFRELDI